MYINKRQYTLGHHLYSLYINKCVYSKVSCTICTLTSANVQRGITCTLCTLTSACIAGHPLYSMYINKRHYTEKHHLYINKHQCTTGKSHVHVPSLGAHPAPHLLVMVCPGCRCDIHNRHNFHLRLSGRTVRALCCWI